MLSLITAAGLLSPLSFGQLQPSPSSFHIAIIDGEGALNNVEGRLAREPIVQVEDKNHKRVPGAYVEFDTPNVAGQPGAQFADGSSRFVTTTDASGRAYAAGLQNNRVTGKFDINVTVKYQGRTVATAVIHQTNICQKVAKVSRHLEHNPAGNQNAQPLAPGMAGVAVGADMLVNGSAVPGNANLANGARLQTSNNPVKIFLGNDCQFLLGPNSLASVNPNALVLEKGAARSEPFGNCSIDSHGLKVLGEEPASEGAVRIANNNLEVGAVSGNVRVTGANGVVKTVVNPCTAAVLALLPGAGGLPLGTGLAIAGAAGALSALPVILEETPPSGSQRPPTSP